MTDKTEKPARSGTAAGFENSRTSQSDHPEPTPQQSASQRASSGAKAKTDLLSGTSDYSRAALTAMAGSAEALMVECEQHTLGKQFQCGSPAVDAVKTAFGDHHAKFRPPHDRIQAAIFDCHGAGQTVTVNAIALALADDPGLATLGGREYLQNIAWGPPSPDKSLAADIGKLANTWRGAARKFYRATHGAQIAEAFGHGDANAFEDARDLEALIQSLDACASQTDYPRPLTGKELCDGEFPDVCFVVQDFILKDHVNLLSGDGGTGKTLLAENMAVAICTGRDWCGRETMQMPVVLLLAEDNEGQTKRRMKEICAAYDIDFAAIPITFWCVSGYDASIAHVADDGQWTAGPFLKPLQELLRQVGPCFLVLDTVSDVASLNENLRPPVNTFCKQVLGGMCRDYGATVLVNAHPSKASMNDGTGYAGSTAWHNAVRHRNVLEGNDDDGPMRTLRVAKSNYGPRAKIELYRDGLTFVTTEAPGRTKADERKAVLNTVIRLIDTGVQVVRANGNGQKPKDVAAAVFERCGMKLTKDAVLGHLNHLERDGALIYRQSDKNLHTAAGFQRGPHCPI